MSTPTNNSLALAKAVLEAYESAELDRCETSPKYESYAEYDQICELLEPFAALARAVVREFQPAIDRHQEQAGSTPAR